MALVVAGAALGLVLGLRGGSGRASAPPRTTEQATLAIRGPARAPAKRRAPASVAAPLTLPRTLPARRLRVPILMYHRVAEPRASLPAITRRLTVDPRDFAAQMRWLKTSGYHTITQRQLYAALERGATLPARPVLVTFDDGYRNVLSNAAPVLRRLGLTATAYVITGRTSGSDVSFLTWGMLKALERKGVEIGSHTVTHAELPSLPDSVALQELIRSRRSLEDHLGHPVQWFAYPAGRFDAHAVALVRQAGYVLAVTTQSGSSQDAKRPLELHRYEVLDATGVRGLRSLLAR